MNTGGKQLGRLFLSLVFHSFLFSVQGLKRMHGKTLLMLSFGLFHPPYTLHPNFFPILYSSCFMLPSSSFSLNQLLPLISSLFPLVSFVFFYICISSFLSLWGITLKMLDAAFQCMKYFLSPLTCEITFSHNAKVKKKLFITMEWFLDNYMLKVRWILFLDFDRFTFWPLFLWPESRC